ncbi:MAG: ABC transporter permease [Nitrososphaerota archaeon]
MKTKIIWMIYTIALLSFLYIPIFMMVIQSFNNSKYLTEWKGFTLKWYIKLFESNEVWLSFINSFTIALASALTSTFLGITLAYTYIRSKSKVYDFLDIAMYTPIIIPEIAEAVSLALFFYLSNISFGWYTVFIGHTAFNIAFAYFTLKAQLSLISKNVEDAALILGAKPIKVLFSVLLPIAMPAIIASLIITFTLSFDDFIKSVFTTEPGFPLLPILIWTRAARARATPDLNALATIMITISLCLASLYTYYMYRRS